MRSQPAFVDRWRYCLMLAPVLTLMGYMPWVAWMHTSHEALRIPIVVAIAFLGLTLFVRETVIRQARVSDVPALGPGSRAAVIVALLLTSAAGFGLGAGVYHLTGLTEMEWTWSVMAPSVLVLALGLAIALAYTSPPRGPTDARYSYAGFPVTDMLVLITLYLLIIWWVVSFLLCVTDPIHKPVVDGSHELSLLASAGVIVAGYGVGAAMTLWLLFRGVFTIQRPPGRRRTPVYILLYLTPVALLLLLGAGVAVGILKTSANWDSMAHLRLSAVFGISAVVATPAVILVLPVMAAAFNVPVAVRHRRGAYHGYQQDIARGYLLLRSLVRAHAPALVVSLPLAMMLSLQPVSGALGVRLLPWGDLAPFTLFNAWLAATLAWMGPLLRDLYLIEDSYTRAYTWGLHASVQALREHVLVLGYGDLGRSFVQKQFEAGVIGYRRLADHMEGSRNVLLPDGSLGKILLRVAIVTARGEGGALARTPDGTPLMATDLTDFLWSAQERERERERPPGVRLVLPTIIGDPTSSEVLQLAGLPEAAFVACALDEQEKPDGALEVLQRLAARGAERAAIPAVLCIHSSNLAPYVTTRVLDYGLPAHYIFPEHLEGMNAANVLHAAVIKIRAINGSWPRVLLCGHGKRMYYLVDSFLRNLSHAEILRLARDQQHEPAILSFGRDASYEGAATELSGVLKRWPGGASLAAEGLRIRELSFSRFVARSPAAQLADSPEDLYPVEHPPLKIPLVYNDSGDYEISRKVLHHFWPDIIVFSNPSAEDELSALHAVVTAIARELDESSRRLVVRELPLLVVSGESGQRPLTRRFENALVFYSSLWRRNGSQGPRALLYPAPGLERTRVGRRFRGDSLVDVLDDPVERMTAVLRAYAPDPRKRSGRVPMELNFCAPDAAGVMASTLTRLAGRSTRADDRPHRYRPSLSNAKVITLNEGGFLVRSFAYLGDGPIQDDPRYSRLSTLWGDERSRGVKQRKRLMALLAHDQPKSRRGRLHRLTDQLSQCCGMPNCPVEAFHKIVASSDQTIGAGMIRDKGARQAHARALAVHYGVDCIDNGSPALLIRTKNAASLPLAMIRLTCNGGEQAGTFAQVMNALLFKHISRWDDAPSWIFNATYVSTYECHDERFAVFTCYGALERRTGAHAIVPALSQVLQKVEIKPSRDFPAWRHYALELKAFLGPAYGEVQISDPDENSTELLGARLLIERLR